MLKSPDGSRERVLQACRDYFLEKSETAFVAGETYIPSTGKVLDVKDLLNLVDSSLDLWLTTGRYAVEFERVLAARFGVKHARLTVSGSAANLLAFSALTSPKLQKKKIQPGSEVLTVAAGFPTTVYPIVQNQCVPVFVDIDLETYNVNVDQLAAAVTPKTRAIMLAHTLGNPFNLEAVTEIAKQNNLYLVEDCCDAMGASFNDRSVGTWGDLATVSFYPAHHITTGEGGAVMTNRNLFARLVASFRDWGRDCWCDPGKENTCKKRFDWDFKNLPYGYDHKYTFTHIGYNMKMTDMQAALGVSQMGKVDQFISRRRENFNALNKEFRAENLDKYFILPAATAKSNPSWFGYMLTIRDGISLNRRDVVRYLEENKIATRMLFAGNLTKQPAMENVEFRKYGALKNTNKVMSDGFWIGVWPGIGEEERNYMIEVFRSMIKKFNP